MLSSTNDKKQRSFELKKVKQNVLISLILAFFLSLTACSQLPMTMENSTEQHIDMNETTEINTTSTELQNTEVKVASGLFLKQDGQTLYLYFPDMMSIQGLREVIPAEGVTIPEELNLGNTLTVSYEGEGTEDRISATALELATGGAVIKPYMRIPIEEGVKIAEVIEEARMIDARESHETSLGVIPGAELVPLTQVDEQTLKDLAESEVPLLIYCRSGNRSGQMMMALKNVGAPLVLNIGGIIEYTGETEVPQN